MINDEYIDIQLSNHSDFCQDDDNYIQMNFLIEKEQKKNVIVDHLSILYNDVFEFFRQGKMAIFNPNIFSKLTQQRFIYWAIDNNPDLKKIFYE